jgi:hypothetical protein
LSEMSRADRVDDSAGSTQQQTQKSGVTVGFR